MIGPRITRRHFAQLAAGSLALTRLGPALAQSAEGTPADPALVKAAQQDGIVNYYHNSDIDTTATWTAAFTKKYNVPTKNMRLPSYPLFDRWLNEERVGRHVADLIQITDPTLLSSAGKQGFVAKYTPPNAAAVSPDLKEEGVWYALSLDYMGIGYNSKRVTPEEEKFLHDAGWNALADPRWKGRMGTATPASGGSSYAFCYMFLEGLKSQYGTAFMQKVAANKPDVYASKAPLFERLAAGEYALMDQGSQGTLTDQYLKGAPVRWVFPAPTPVAVTAQCISAHAPHANAARLFQEWSISLEAEALWMSLVAAGPTRQDAVDSRKRDHKDWFAESWYADPTALYTDYLKQPDFADPKKPVIAEWNDIFGYQSGRKG
jgi:iron(III) transport system substrate-binding protein